MKRRNPGDAMKRWISIVVALLIETQAHAQTDASSAKVYYPSCLAAADIVQGKRPAAKFRRCRKAVETSCYMFWRGNGNHEP